MEWQDSDDDLCLDELLRRDPRMVERKKTGLAKARKRVCLFLQFYLSHITDSFSLSCSSMLGSSVRGFNNFALEYTYTSSPDL